MINGLTSKGENKLKLWSIVLLIIFAVGCAPSGNNNSIDSSQKGLSSEELKDRNDECKLYNSFAAGNMNNRDYLGAVENYNYMVDIGCSNCECLGTSGEDAEYIYAYYGRAYIELNKLDSASYVFKQGLKYLDNDETLLDNAQWAAGKQGKLEEQIYYLDRWLAIDETNLIVLNKFSEVYKNSDMFEEQIQILDMILKFSPGDKSANAEKKAAFLALGKDELDVDKERWNSDQSNTQYGKDYVRGLLDRDRNEEVVSVCNSLLVYDKYDPEILKYLGDAHLNLYNEDQAIEAYQSIAKIDKSDYLNAIELSKLYINKEEFEVALDWAEKAVQFSGKKGISLNQRAEVYFSLAENCSSESLTFWDKLVFEIAWQDYSEAAKSGYARAKVRADFLFENNITKSSDWFMSSETDDELIPKGDCYSWINRSVRRK